MITVDISKEDAELAAMIMSVRAAHYTALAERAENRGAMIVSRDAAERCRRIAARLQDAGQYRTE